MLGKSLLSFLILICLNVNAQSWIKYDVDSVLSLDMPDNYVKKDTLGQTVITGRIENAMVTVVITGMPDSVMQSVHSREDLKQVYIDFRKGVLQGSNGELVESHFAQQGEILLTQFTVKMELMGEKQARHCIAVYVKGKIYTIFFAELLSKSRDLTPERTRVFESVKMNRKLVFEDQLYHGPELPADTDFSSRLKYMAIGAGVVLTVIIGIVLLILKLTKVF